MRLQASAILLSALLCACSGGAPDPRGVGHGEVLLQVAATGRSETRPDEARFTVGVESVGPSAAAASAANNQKMSRMVAALDRLGVKGDDLQTRALTIHRIDYGPERGRFQARNVVELRVREIGRAGEAIAAATEAGANLLSGPDMRVSDPEAASRSAYAAAYRAARARAEAYAEAAGLRIVRVLAIRDSGATGGGPMMSHDRDMSAQATAPPPEEAAPPVRPGLNASEVRVRADFALAE
ncbi:MAG TPA: SIMPL domain-containing protein [Allosphingosinicella sp.]